MTKTQAQSFRERLDDTFKDTGTGCGCLGFAIFALWCLATGTSLLVGKINSVDDGVGDFFLLGALALVNGIFGGFIGLMLSLATSAVIAFVGPFLPSRPKTTELHDAVRQGHFADVQRILNTPVGARLINRNTRTRSRNGETPLSCCVDNADIARLLLAHGADPHVRIARFGTGTVLHHLAKYATKDVVNAVLAHGANINIIASPTRETPLHEAAKEGNTGAVEALLDGGANVDALDEQQRTALHLVCVFDIVREPDRIAIVRLLLDRGAKVNSVDRDGRTPLAMCVERYVRYGDSVPSPSVLDVLIDRGANVHMRLWGRSLTDYASQEKSGSGKSADPRLIEILEGHR